MTTKHPPASPQQLVNFTSRKVTGLADTLHDAVPDSLTAWTARYLTFAVVGVRSPAIAEKIALHLDRFIQFFTESYGHDRISTLLKRDVLAWQRALKDQGFASATINNHLASLSGFTTWVHTPSRLRCVHPEDAVPVVIDGRWSPVGRDDHTHEEKIPRRVLLCPKEQRQQRPRCPAQRAPVNRRKEGQPWPPSFQPVMRAGIGRPLGSMHERPRLSAPLPSAAVSRGTPRLRATDPRCPKNASHTRPGEGDSFLIPQLLGEMLLIEADILPRR